MDAGDQHLSQGPVWRGCSGGVEQTVAVGRVIGEHVRAGDMIGLVGELGAGKTQLVRGLAEGMGLDPAGVSSPTFVLVQEYTAGSGDRTRLVHMDAYRIGGAEDLASIGWEAVGPEGISGGGDVFGGAVVVVEWVDRLMGSVGEDWLQVEMTHEGPDRRGILVRPHGGWVSRLGALRGGLEKVLGGDADAAGWQPRCPVCRREVSEGEGAFPFCSRRCKQVDLGRWLGGRYVVSRSIDQEDLEGL